MSDRSPPVTAPRYNVAALYPWPRFVTDGVLIAYSVEPTALWRSTAGYVGCLLRDDKVAELPIQLPAIFALDLNLKAAKELTAGQDLQARLALLEDGCLRVRVASGGAAVAGKSYVWVC